MKISKHITTGPNKKHRYKIVIIGDGNVGKTSIKRTYLGLDYIDNYEMTIGVEISKKNLGKTALQIWDLGGQKGFQQLFGSHFAKAKAAVVVFDITNPNSFHNVSKWIEMISIEKQQMIPTVLVGNKSDKRNKTNVEVSYTQGLEFARELSNNSIHEIPYVETSALTGLNIDYIFEYIQTTLNLISDLM